MVPPLLERLKNLVFVEEKRIALFASAFPDFVCFARCIGLGGGFRVVARDLIAGSLLFLQESFQDDPNLHFLGGGERAGDLRGLLLGNEVENLVDEEDRGVVTKGELFLDFLEEDVVVLGQEVVVNLQIQNDSLVGFGETVGEPALDFLDVFIEKLLKDLIFLVLESNHSFDPL